MVFWKTLFNHSKTQSASEENLFEGDMLEIAVDGIGQARVYFSTERDIDLYQLEELCDLVGWARRPVRKVKKALQHSFLVVSMWEVNGTRKRLIGFARATSDHVFNATIWDVVIHPRFQNRGLGKALMQYIIRKLRTQEISNVTLFADPQVVEFYRRLGFIQDPEGIKGMFWYPD